ncbi:thioesterase-like superfamily-domain-containing protein [Pestalotiopsis sp. NC0098]|nr:thioesterase-like superfamily-domain-containing protein [Pestalotiopsis sp. NC0098]
MVVSLAEQLAIDEIKPGEYASRIPPERMGNVLPIAYGGCTLSIAAHAACKTVPSTHRLYSLVGQFLGPASTDEKLHCTVHSSRDTKTFATRRVQVSQVRPDGQKRICLELLADFQIEEPAMLTYSSPPVRQYSGPEKSRSFEKLALEAVSRGQLDAKVAAQVIKSFSLGDAFFDTRLCPEGVSGQNVMGANKQQQTTQDHLDITDKTSGDWSRTRAPLETRDERVAAVAFLLDGGLSFLPLGHSNMWLDDSAACSSLDFALRLFASDIDLSSWHLRERRTTAGGLGRTYTEGRLWDENGKLVASMTQQSIMRPPREKTKGKL